MKTPQKVGTILLNTCNKEALLQLLLLSFSSPGGSRWNCLLGSRYPPNSPSVSRTEDANVGERMHSLTLEGLAGPYSKDQEKSPPQSPQACVDGEEYSIGNLSLSLSLLGLLGSCSSHQERALQQKEPWVPSWE